MGDLECGFEEMQGVRLGYLLIKGKQMFALSQVFTDLLKNIPRTTVHKRMDHLKVKKHHCDLEELRKLKAIHSIAFHAAKCTLISREDVEALYISCKTERVLKSNKRKAKVACAPEPKETPSDLLHADAELWKQKVWFSLHGVPETVARHNKPGRRKERGDSKLPQFYHKSTGREQRSVARSSLKHFKNYENDKITGNRFTLNQRHGVFRSSVTRQPVLFQSATATQSKQHSRSAGDLLHKRKRRREGGGGRDGARQHSWGRSKQAHHVSPVLFLHPKSSGSSFGSFHLSPEFYFDPRLQHYHHDPHESFPESYASDTESSIYSDRDNQDSDFGSGLTSTSSSDEEEEDEEESESSEVSTDEENSTSQSDSSSVSSKVSVQSIRFRRARVGSLPRSLNKAPLVLQPTFHYNNQDAQHKSDLVGPSQSDLKYNGAKRGDFGPLQPPKFNPLLRGDGFFTDSNPENASDPDRTVDHKLGLNQSNLFQTQGLVSSKYSPGLRAQSDHDKTPKCSEDKLDDFKANCVKVSVSPPKKMKAEAEELLVTGPHSHSDEASIPFNIHNVKIKEESCDGYEYQGAGVVGCKGDITVFKHITEENCDAYTASPCGPQECRSTQDTAEEGGRFRTRNCKTMAPGKRPVIPRTKPSRPKSTLSTSSSSSSRSEDAQMLDLPSRRKRSATFTVASPVKTPFRLMANFPSTPSLVVGSDGDLCPAHSLNSLRGIPGPPPQSHPVWKWQPGGHIFPPPHAQRTRK
ncbi:SKI/DACH domain-containing protein 1 [Eucyclogobius newberryi]|uniref:SKI/DACH domain-containing protein 1 n=1 Tax=Eucyclogobius newberryi TaxID=166745 RepID=UPI003B5C4DEB